MSPPKKFFYVLLGVNLLLIGGLGITFYFADSIATKRSAEIAVAKADIESNELAIKSFQSLEKAIQQNQEIETIASRVLPQDTEQTKALAELDKFSKEAGVPIRQISFTPGKGGSLVSPTNIKGVSVLQVSLQCDPAQYEDLLDFLKKIEDNRRRMQVTSVAITPSDTAPGLLDRTNLSIDIYLRP